MKMDLSSSWSPDGASDEEGGARAFEDRRRRPEIGRISDLVRRSVERRAYAVREDNSVIDLRVVDLSFEGCAVETIERLAPGEPLRLTMLGCGVVNARVRWYKDRRAGLLFDPDEVPGTYRQRNAERLVVSAQASLRRAGRQSYPVRMFDLSAIGCKCEFIERPAIGELVWVKFAHLRAIEAEVCWLADSSIGLKFTTPIHPAVFEVLLGRLLT